MKGFYGRLPSRFYLSFKKTRGEGKKYNIRERKKSFQTEESGRISQETDNVKKRSSKL